MTDIEDLREQYAPRPGFCGECGGPYTDAETLVCNRCNAIHIPDPRVLALCDEVEALRQTVRGCETCGGDGVMMVPAGYNEDEVGDLRPEVCAECHGTCVSSWGQAIDEAAALRAEVEALRAQVAAAPDVLREWPKTVEEAPGEWFFCIHGDCAPRGTFATRDGYTMPVFVDESGGSLWVSGEMKPGEFFVRVP